MAAAATAAAPQSVSVLQARRDRWFARPLVTWGSARAWQLDGLPEVGSSLVSEKRDPVPRRGRGGARARVHARAHGIRTYARDGVHEEEAGREEPEDAPRTGLAAGQQRVLRLQPARPDLRQHDDRLVRLHLLLWYAVSSSGSDSLRVPHRVHLAEPLPSPHPAGSPASPFLAPRPRRDVTLDKCHASSSRSAGWCARRCLETPISPPGDGGGGGGESGRPLAIPGHGEAAAASAIDGIRGQTI